MRNGLLFVIVFFFCIYFIVWDISPKPFTDIPRFLLYFFLMPLPVAYAGIFISYLVLVKGYNGLKFLFYDCFISGIHRAINSNSSFIKEIAGTYIFSIFMNVFILFFIASTPLSDIIPKIPGLESITLKNLNFTVFDYQYLSKLGTDIVMFPFMTFGTITLFILKFIRRREHNQQRGNYPGARAILGFCYATFVIILVNGIIASKTYNSMTFGVSDFAQNISQSVMLTAFGCLVPFMMVCVDRLLIQKPTSNKS